MKAYVYLIQKTAMQSGAAHTHMWAISFDPQHPQTLSDPVMGWSSTDQTQSQVQLTFSSKDEALAYCARHNIEAECVPQTLKATSCDPKSYADNFTKGYRN